MNDLSTFGVDKASYYTDVQSYEVDEGVLIVSANEHAHVSDQNILEAPDDGGGEGRVVGRAEDGREDEDEAKDAGEKELCSKHWVRPPSKLWDRKIVIYTKLKEKISHLRLCPDLRFAKRTPEL